MRTIYAMTAMLALLVVSEAAAQRAADGSCPLSTVKDGQAASVRGKLAYGAHDLLLVIRNCDKAVVLEYAGGPETTVSSHRLVRDENFKRFEKYARGTYGRAGKGPCVQCPKYEVEATFTGGLSVAPDAVPEGQWKDDLGMLHDRSGKFVGNAGFGHPPIYKYRLVIESVSDIVARQRPRPRVPDNSR